MMTTDGNPSPKPTIGDSIASMSDMECGYANGRPSDSDLRHLCSPSCDSCSHIQEGRKAPVRTEGHKHRSVLDFYQAAVAQEKVFWERLKGTGRERVGWVQSGKNALYSSWLNVLLIALPLAWAARFLLHDDENSWGHKTPFALCFIAIIPLEGLFDWGGEQMAIYLGKTLGDLLVITLNNVVEATLAIILLVHCEMRLLQSTIVGIVILHLLLVPGTAFLVGGARVLEQTLHPHHTQLNHSLLTIGVLSLLLPTAFFAALDRGPVSITRNGFANFKGSALVNDETRAELLHMSRCCAFILAIVYIGSRIYLSNPPGDENSLIPNSNVPEEIKQQEEELMEHKPEIDPLPCFLLLCVTVAFMATTAEYLVESIEFIREEGGIREEWFGLVLLPIVSFSADGVVTIGYFVRSNIMHFLGRKVVTPCLLARARAIDLSVQFILWWMPFLIILGWMSNRPMMLLFDFFELALLLGSCFLVNYVTADAKTNWVEGLILVAFYIMIAVSAWSYAGQPELEVMLSCPGTIAQALMKER